MGWDLVYSAWNLVIPQNTLFFLYYTILLIFNKSDSDNTANNV